MPKKILILAVLAVAIVMGTNAYALDVDLSNPSNYSGQTSTLAYSTASPSTLALQGNVWAVIDLGIPFTVQADSVLTFTYSSTLLPEIAGIVFDNPRSASVLAPHFGHVDDEPHAFCFGGTDLWYPNTSRGWPGAAYNSADYTEGDYGTEMTFTFSLASILGVGNTYQYMIFVNDDDGSGIDGNGCFSNVSISSATPIPGAVWLLGSGLAGLVGLRRKMKA